MYKGKWRIDIIGYIFFILFLFVTNTVLTSVSERGHEDEWEKKYYTSYTKEAMWTTVLFSCKQECACSEFERPCLLKVTFNG